MKLMNFWQHCRPKNRGSRATRLATAVALGLTGLFSVGVAATPVQAQNKPSAGMMQYPDVSETQIVFS